MEAAKTKFATVEEYIAAQPPQVRALLEEMRSTILKAATGAKEVISYSMPAVKLHGMLVWYAAFKEHIGFYPKPSGIEAFQKELTKYKCSKGAVQFPLEQLLPLSLVTKMVKYRVKENLEQASIKTKRATKKG